jgi:hypothetical protein
MAKIVGTENKNQNDEKTKIEVIANHNKFMQGMDGASQMVHC